VSWDASSLMSSKTVTAKKHVPGRYPESASLRNVLRRLGVTSDLCTEEILFGLGGGIGCGYFLFDLHGGHPVYIGTRIHAKESDTPYFMLQMTEGWGATAEVKHSSSPAAGDKSLTKILNDGATPIVWVDTTKLPYMYPAGRPNGYHTVAVYGLEGDEAIVGDLGESELRLTMKELTEARHSNYAPKFRTVVVTEAPSKPDLREMLTDRLNVTTSQMLEGLGIANFGLTAMTKWADMLTNTKNKKGWVNCFTTEPALHGTLSSIFEQIELRGYAGSAFRGLYADFIEQAADVLKKTALKKLAGKFRESEALWHATAFAALPNTVPLLKETREALLRRSALLRKARTAAIDKELESLRERLKELREKSAKDLALSKEEKLDLFSAMRERILETEAIERAAFTELRSIV
jgi:hypothetical protein